ncbi:Gti1/Pac2 family-domain-containing protein [Syncephalis fuscata]|nr:Gti1/Pac2 family-domain-containing protein [Syncephalis fuscata]
MSMVAYEGFVDTVYDALILFEAFSFNKIPRVTRRLTREEREFIHSGVVFIWDEDEAGILRWTDGRRWSSSRPCGNFIVYDELDAGMMRDSMASGAPIAAHPHNLHHLHSHHPSVMYNNRNSGHMASWSMNSPSGYNQVINSSWHTMHSDTMMPSRSYNTARNSYPVLRGGLIKRALSINAADGRRMHMVSYYTANEVEQKRLQIPRMDPRFEGIQIRKDLYPELICETSLNGGTTWRFAEAQGRGHAYAAGMREGKTTPARSENSSSPSPAKEAEPVEEVSSEASAEEQSSTKDSKSSLTASVSPKVISNKPVAENSYEQQIIFHQKPQTNVPLATPQRTPPYGASDAVPTHSHAVLNNSIHHTPRVPSASPYIDHRVPHGHSAVGHWEANCDCPQCHNQAQRAGSANGAAYNRSELAHSRSSMTPGRYSLTPSVTPTASVSSRMSSTPAERSHSWADHHYQQQQQQHNWRPASYPHAIPLTPNQSQRHLPSMAGARVEDNWPHYSKPDTPSPAYHGAASGPCTDPHCQSCFYRAPAHFPQPKPTHAMHHSAYTQGLPPPQPHPISYRSSSSPMHSLPLRSPPYTAQQVHVMRMDSNSPHRMHPYRRTNSHDTYESQRGFTASSARYSPRHVQQSPLASPYAATIAPPVSRYSSEQQQQQQPTQHRMLARFPDTEVKHPHSAPVMQPPQFAGHHQQQQLPWTAPPSRNGISTAPGTQPNVFERVVV